MSERIDDVSRTVAASPTRRSALRGLSALALGTLGILGVRPGTSARNNNTCNQCKQQCRRNNKKGGKKRPNNCNSKCRTKCKSK